MRRHYKYKLNCSKTMSTFIMPYISNRLITISPIFLPLSQEQTPIISQSLYHYLKVLKDNIDNYQNDWDNYKRYTNPYESIHTHNINNNSQPVCPIRPLSRSYFKMIEICNSFDLLSNMPKNMKSFHIAEGPGGFIEALSNLRNNQNDYYVGITLISDDTHVPGWKKTKVFLDKNPNVFIERGEDGTGDITKYNNLLYCSKKYGASIDLVTADGGFDFSIDYNSQESQMSELLISQLAVASAVQKQGGTFILKVFDIFTKLSVDILYILCIMYDKVNIIKPNTSRYANSERYIVAQGFRSEDGRRDWTIQFAPIFEHFNTNKKNDIGCENKNENENPTNIQKNTQIVSLLTEDIPKYFITKIEESNLTIGQQQLDTISNTLTLIKNPRQDKIEKLRLSNIQKCVLWCQKHKLPYNRDIRHFNMFLSAKNKVSKVPRIQIEQNPDRTIIDVSFSNLQKDNELSNEHDNTPYVTPESTPFVTPELIPIDISNCINNMITNIINNDYV